MYPIALVTLDGNACDKLSEILKKPSNKRTKDRRNCRRAYPDWTQGIGL
jgi:hypothetical protein